MVMKDDNGNIIYRQFRDSHGNEYWQEFDDNNNAIYYLSSSGFECWYTYNSYGVQTSHLTNPNTTQESLWSR